MFEEKMKLAQEFIEFVKNHNVTNDGPITSNTIEEKMGYTKRHFNRIFKEFSIHTPLEISERFRLTQCVEHIRNGHTLKDTALKFEYSPEGLSNAIRKNLNLNVNMIRTSEFKLKKHIKISGLWIQLDNFELQFDKSIFMDLLDGLNEENVLKSISSQSSKFDYEAGVDIHLDLKAVIDIVEKFDGLKLDKKSYENLLTHESVIMYAILIKNLEEGKSSFTMSTSLLTSSFFILGFFFDIDDLDYSGEYYQFSIDYRLKLLLESLKEIREVTCEQFDIMLHCSFTENCVTVELNNSLKKAINMIVEGEQ